MMVYRERNLAKKEVIEVLMIERLPKLELQGLAIEPGAATAWLSKLPLSGRHPDLGDELRWWSHLQRWALSLIARGRWLPQVQLKVVLLAFLVLLFLRLFFLSLFHMSLYMCFKKLKEHQSTGRQ